MVPALGLGTSTVTLSVSSSTIGSSANYAEVLENPDTISKNVLARGLDSGTAFNILSIDIADVDVGDNIGARLQTDQAEADKRIAQAAAEGGGSAGLHAPSSNTASAGSKIPEARLFISFTPFRGSVRFDH